MKIIDIPLGNGADINVTEQNDTLSINVSATILGTPENVTLNFSLGTLLSMIAAKIANPILGFAFKSLAALI